MLTLKLWAPADVESKNVSAAKANGYRTASCMRFPCCSGLRMPDKEFVPFPIEKDKLDGTSARDIVDATPSQMHPGSTITIQYFLAIY
jgi:hypothetical protein